MYFTIVGLKYYINKWGNLDIKSEVDLIIENKNAIACYFENEKIGYVAKIEVKDCKKYIKKNKNVKFTVRLKRGLNQPILINIKGE